MEVRVTNSTEAGGRFEDTMISQNESEFSHVAIPNSCKRGDVIHTVFQQKRTWIFMNKCQSHISVTLLIQLSQNEIESPCSSTLEC